MSPCPRDACWPGNTTRIDVAALPSLDDPPDPPQPHKPSCMKPIASRKTPSSFRPMAGCLIWNPRCAHVRAWTVTNAPLCLVNGHNDSVTQNAKSSSKDKKTFLDRPQSSPCQHL